MARAAQEFASPVLRMAVGQDWSAANAAEDMLDRRAAAAGGRLPWGASAGVILGASVGLWFAVVQAVGWVLH